MKGLLLLNKLSVLLLASAILATNLTLSLQKSLQSDTLPQAIPAWSESMTAPHTEVTGGFFKAIAEVNNYFTKHNLEPGASANGGIKLMYKIE